jgi:sugar phosphate isomerase/epimerase
MQLGIFAYTFVRASVEQVFDAVRAHGMANTEWNYVAIGQQEVPDAIDPAFAERIRVAAAERGISVDSVAGYTNLIDPDPERRHAGLRRLCGLIRSAPAHGAGRVALCTGSRDADSMWRWHDGNDAADAWADLLCSLGECIHAAEEADVTLVFEPEVNNVVHTARKARRLLDELQSPRLKVVFDGANIYHKGELARQQEMLTEAIDLLGNDIALAHAKDIEQDGDAGHAAAGTGKLDFGHYLSELARTGYDGPLLIHGLEEHQVPDSVRFLRGHLADIR